MQLALAKEVHMGSNNKEVFVPTQDQKSKAPDMVIYEIQMFFYSLDVWRCNPNISNQLGGFLHNACLEVTLVHSRVLLGFFECSSTKRHNDDVLSVDIGFPDKPIEQSKKLRQDINKRLAHLTYSRLSFQDKEAMDWSYELFEPLEKRCNEFLNAEAPNDIVSSHGTLQIRAIWEDLKKRPR